MKSISEYDPDNYYDEEEDDDVVNIEVEDANNHITG